MHGGEALVGGRVQDALGGNVEDLAQHFRVMVLPAGKGENKNGGPCVAVILRVLFE